MLCHLIVIFVGSFAFDFINLLDINKLQTLIFKDHLGKLVKILINKNSSEKMTEKLD